MKYPVEIVTTLDDLMRFEYMVQTGKILPDRPIYSILAGRHAAPMRGRGLDFEEVRKYVSGDDIRNVDWRVTARTNEAHSKVFNEEKERPTFFLLDQSSTMFFGSQNYVKSVVAAQISSLAAFYTIKRGDRFGGMIFNENGYDYVAPKRSRAHIQHFLQLAVNYNELLPSRKTVMPNTKYLNEMLQRAESLITHDYIVGIVTDILMLDDESKRYLQSISYHNDIILIHIEDPMDRELPGNQSILSDGEKQLLWSNQKKHMGARFSTDYSNRLSDLIEKFRHYAIPVSVIDTVTPLEIQFISQMKTHLKKKI